jgi:hypothetical protein
VRRKPRITKITDVVVEVSCSAGPGKIREEVWQDEAKQVARFNMAFINHFLCGRDNGRVLGYDMAHGYSHRHYTGKVEEIEFPGYEELSTWFYREVGALRKKGKL